MTSWLSAVAPRKGNWSNGRLQAEIRDDGVDITTELNTPLGTFTVYVNRRSGSDPHYFVQDIAGSAYVGPESTRQGAGTFLVNTVIQYLQALADPSYTEIRGDLFDVPGAESPEHAVVRRRFFQRFGAIISDERAVARVGALATVPGWLPLSDSPSKVVIPLADFQW